MAGNLIYITDAGRAALVAQGNTGTTARQVTQIGLGTAAFVFKPSMTALPNELKRITTFGGDTVAADTIHLVIQDDSTDQYKLYAFGLYLDNGVLFGVYVQDTPILEKAPASMLLLAADTVFTSIDVAKLTFGPTSFLNPPATSERKGVVELATQAEVDAGTDDTRTVTPKTAAARYAPLVRPQLTGPVSVTSTASDQDAQLAIKAPTGALNREAKMRFHGTFGTGGTDTGVRLIASIRAAFIGGAWGRESLGFWINDGTANDAASDAKQKRVMSLTASGVQVDGGMSTTSRPTFAGNLAWDAGNFNPADYVSKFQTNAQKIVSSLYLDRTGIGGTTALFLDGDDGQEQVLAFRTSGKHKWLLSSAAALSNLNLFRYDDNGTNLGSVLFIDRATGRASLGVRPRFNGYEAWDAGNLDPTRFLTYAGANQHATGSFLFEGSIVTQLPDVSGVSLGRNSALPNVLWRYKDGAVDEKLWDIQAYGSSLQFRAVNDTWSGTNTWMTVLRNGTVVTGISMSVRPQFAGNLAWDAGNFNPGDYVSKIATATQSIVGELTVDRKGRGGRAAYSLDADSGQEKAVIFRTTGVLRWMLSCAGATDALNLNRFADDGTNLGALVSFARDTGVAKFTARPTWAGATPWDSQNLTPLDRNVGGQINGTVTLYGAGDFGSQLVINANGYGPRIQSQASSQQLMITNGANTAANVVVKDNGTVSFPRARPNWAGLTPWDTGNFDPNSKINRGGDTMNGRLSLARDGWDADLGLRAADGWQTFLRARRGGGIELINNAYNAVTASFEDNGNLHIGGSSYQSDGNIWMPWAGGKYLSALFGGDLELAFSRGNPGFWRHPCGFLIQLGYQNGPFREGNPPVVNFPLAFPSVCMSLQATAQNASGSVDSDIWMQVRWWNNAGFQPFVQSSGQGSIDGFFWLAIGW
ncbi:hypothetical protein [Burkholderia territorii]|uniref:gp53-like domain-containing protein n=1 Tax=Burkholderia territorii TaxID=1503055 RepID=UPI000AC2A2C4|nr:hypothetical protein [Burkholderia territorii]